MGDNGIFLLGKEGTITFGEAERTIRSLSEAPGVFLLEADHSFKTVLRFLSLMEGGHTVLMLSSWNFRDPEFLSKLRIESGTDFRLWALEDERPSLPSGNSRHPLIRSTPGFMVRTSGSSGKFKLALHDYGLFKKKYHLVGMHFERTFLFSPAESIAGIETILEAWHTRSTLVVSGEKMTPMAVISALNEFQVDYFQTTPSFLNLMMVGGKFRSTSPVKLSKIAYGSEPPQEKVLSEIRKNWKGVKLIQTYGMSEIGIQRTLETENPVTFRFDEKFNQGRLNSGKLEIKTLTPLIGYLNFEQQLTDDGWFMTHDEATERDGVWTVSGRAGDLINVAGRKFFPAELEELLMKIPDVFDVTVKSEDNDISGKIVLAEIFSESEEKTLRLTIKKFLETSVPSFMHPQRITISKEIPESPRFKKIRKTL